MFSIFAGKYLSMKKEKEQPNALLVHIEHSKPIELNEFSSSLNAVGSLFSSFTGQHSDLKEMAGAKLYVEKIENCCIDIVLCDMISPGIIPFMENINIFFDFAMHLKNVLGYYMHRKGEKPSLSISECRDLKNLLNITAGDSDSRMRIGAIHSGDKKTVFNECTFNFFESNSAQNQLRAEMEQMKSLSPSETVFSKQLMTIYRMCGNMNTNSGNRAVIESISKNKIALIFDDDELKSRILGGEYNPTRKGFVVDVSVDVSVQTVDDKPALYKVLRLHEIVDID